MWQHNGALPGRFSWHKGQKCFHPKRTIIHVGIGIWCAVEDGETYDTLTQRQMLQELLQISMLCWQLDILQCVRTHTPSALQSLSQTDGHCHQEEVSRLPATPGW